MSAKGLSIGSYQIINQTSGNITIGIPSKRVAKTIFYFLIAALVLGALFTWFFFDHDSFFTKMVICSSFIFLVFLLSLAISYGLAPVKMIIDKSTRTIVLAHLFRRNRQIHFNEVDKINYSRIEQRIGGGTSNRHLNYFIEFLLKEGKTEKLGFTVETIEGNEEDKNKNIQKWDPVFDKLTEEIRKLFAS